MRINSYMPTRLIVGEATVKKNADLLIKKGNRCLILTGKSSAKLSGALDDVISIFEENGTEYIVVDTIEQNPLTSTCRHAGDEAIRFGAEYILGIGGGSVLDAAKAVAIFACHPEMSHLDIYNRIVPSRHLPVVLIGTTSGTGSEVTGVSVLTNADTGIKKSISGADCYADISFGDYMYTLSTNTDIRVSTALDAFCHAVEAMLADSADEIVFMYSEKAIRLLAPYILSGNFEFTDKTDFEKVYIASLYAGFAINTAGTDFPHTVGYVLTENCSVPHGKACAVFMPELLMRAKKYCPEKFEAILSMCSCSSDELCDSVKKLADVKVSYSEDAIRKISLRWKDGVKNFDRSPGGYSYKDAEKALLALI